jgi:hypothetical protein
MKTNQLLAAAVAAFLSVGAYAQTVDEIVEKHVTALGGMDKLNGVQTVTSDMSIAVQGMEIPIKTTVVRGKAFRSQSNLMGNDMISVVSGTTGWMVRPTMMGGTGDPEDMPADELKQQSAQLDPFGALVGYKEKGYTVALVGKEQLNKKDVYHLKLTDKDGSTFDEWVDAGTYMVSKVSRQVNGQEAGVEFEEYQDVQGIKFAKTVVVNSPMGPLTMNTDKVVLNAPVDEAIFKKPAK